MLTLKKLVLVAACVACALGASASAAAPQQRHLRSVAIERATTETFALIAKDSDENEDGDEDSAVESTDDEAATTMETFPLAIESDEYQWQDEQPSAFTEEYGEGKQRDADDDDEEEDNESPGTDDDDEEQSPGTDDDDESVSDEVDTAMEGGNDSEDSVEDSDSIEDTANDDETPDGDDDDTTADLTIDIDVDNAN